METVFESRPNLFPPKIKEIEQVREIYHCFRTWRKTSDTRAIEKKVDGKDIDIVNRWDQVGDSQKKMVYQPMKQYYVQLELLLGPFLRYTQAM